MTSSTEHPTSDPTPEAADRRPTLRRSLTVALVAVAVLSVLLLGAMNFAQARQLLTGTVEDVLIDQQATRAQSVRDGLERLRNQVALSAADPVIVEATTRFSEAFDELEATPSLLTTSQDADLDALYAELEADIAEAGLEIPAFRPTSAAERYLQYHYVLENPNPLEERAAMTVAAGDNTPYGAAHADLHEDILRLALSPAVGDLLLIDTQGTIVYSTDKRLDIGTSTVSGPFKDSALSRAVNVRLPTVPAGEAVYVDFSRYLPAQARPVLFAVAGVRSGTTTVGAIAVQIRGEALDAITTSDGQWSDTALGETGEAYVVGSDRLMRSNSRLWLEDPDEYQRRLRETGQPSELGGLIALFDSTALLQPVDTEAVRASLRGETFAGFSDGYLGDETLAVASPVGAGQLNWVLVAAVDTAEAGRPLWTYTQRILLIAAILIPLVAVAAYWLARRMTRPVKPIVASAAAVAKGDLETELPDLGRNEFGDIARRLNTLTSDLRQREQELHEEEAAITNLLLSALPARVVRSFNDSERQLEDLVDTATVVAIRVGGLIERAAIDEDSALDFGVGLSQRLESLASELDVERVRSSSAEHVFAVGFRSADTETELGARFAVRAAEVIDAFADEVGVDLSHHIGMCAGDVVAAVVGSEQLTYSVIGDSVRTAQALESLARENEILVCDATAGTLGPGWDFETPTDLLDLRGEPVSARVLAGQPQPEIAPQPPVESTSDV